MCLEAVAPGMDKLKAELGMESWDEAMGNSEGAATENQADEGGHAGLDGKSIAGSSMPRPKHSWEWVLEPIEQARAVILASKASSGRLWR